MFTCKICHNDNGNTSIQLEELMYGFKDKFDYFQCGSCGCIQIVHPPENMVKYYPEDYYSYTCDASLHKEKFYKKLQSRAYTGDARFLFARLALIGYPAPEWWMLLRKLKLFSRNARVLDIGSGNGELLKKFYSLGYKDLTGVDPYIKKDIIYNKFLRVLKKTVFELNRQYQAIMMHHSLEHMDEQEKVLAQVHSLLSANGHAIIRIPVVSKPLMDKYGKHVVSLDPPRHFFIHTIKSFTNLVTKIGFKIDQVVYDAHEFSFWASEQYQMGISLHHHPNSFLIHQLFSEHQIMEWKTQIRFLNEQCSSDNVAIYLSKE